MIAQIVWLVLSAFWLFNASYQRFGNAGSVCSGSNLNPDWVKDWGYPGPYLA